MSGQALTAFMFASCLCDLPAADRFPSEKSNSCMGHILLAPDPPDSDPGPGLDMPDGPANANPNFHKRLCTTAPAKAESAAREDSPEAGCG